MEMRLTDPQFRFLQMPQKFRLFLGGFGSGKTYASCCSLLSHHFTNPGTLTGFFPPALHMLKSVFYPTMQEVADRAGFDLVIKLGDKEVHYYHSGRYYGKTICRSLDNPALLVGFSASHIVVDELDVLPAEAAAYCWAKLLGRLRRSTQTGDPNRIDVTSTPEGHRFLWQRWVRDATDNYSMVTAATRTNKKNLPDDYEESIRSSLSEELCLARLDGQFVNLTHGQVYRMFDRHQNNSTETIEDREPLMVGMDFNVDRMCAVIGAYRPQPAAIQDAWPYQQYQGGSDVLTIMEEIVNARDTNHIIDLLKSRYGRHALTIYPDSSGKSRKSVDAARSDIKLLRDAGFRVRHRSRNPFVRDRVNSVNSLFCNASGERLLRVNIEQCPRLTEALELQSYNDHGEPDKTQGFDDIADALGYLVNYEKGLVKPTTRIVNF